METLATPYHKLNRVFLSIIGQWPHQSRYSSIICYTYMIFLTVTHGYFQTAGMIVAFTIDIDIFLEAIPTVLADIVCIVKMINFSINAEKMKKLLVIMEEDWQIYTSGDENKILNDYAKFGRKVTIYYAGALYGTLVPMGLVPIVPIVLDFVAPINGSYPKHLMFQQIEFLFDLKKYFFPLLIHGYLGTFAYLSIIISIDTMFMVYIQHSCAKFLIIEILLKRVASDENYTKLDEVQYKQLVACIGHHNKAIEYANLIEKANYISFIPVIGINMFMMTASALVAVLKMDNPDIAMKFVFFTFGEVFHLFYSNWQGELLFSHSENIFNQVYQSNWNYTSARSQKLIIPLLLRSKVPSKLTAGRIYTMSLKSFTMVIKSSFSYLTVFSSMRS